MSANSVSQKPIVALTQLIGPADEESIRQAVAKSIGDASDFPSLVSGRSVVLKPNVFCPSPAPVTTDPRVIAALIKLAYEFGARKVTVAEGRSISTAKFRAGGNSTRACFAAVGMDKAALDNGAEIVYLEEDEFVELSNPDAAVLKTAHMPKAIAEVEVLINVPVLKNHSLTLTTLGVKNLHGTVSDADKLFGHDFHHINDKLVDILLYARPALTVIDGVQGLEGDHADMGTPVQTGVIISSTDTVAADAIAEAVMGLGNLEVETTKTAHRRGVGVGDRNAIQVIGTNIDRCGHTFARPDIEISEERFPGLRVIAGEHCRGCQYYIRRGLDRLVAESILDPNDPITIVFGKEPDIGEHPEGRVILIGDCALASASVKRLRDHLWLTGRLRIVYCCPPMEFRMRAVELAGD